MIKRKRAAFALVAGLLAGPARSQTDVEQLFESAQQARAQGNLADAVARYLEVIRRAPQLASAYHNLGIVYFSQRKYREASAALEKAIQRDAHLPQAHFMLGLSCYQLYEPHRAVRAFSDSLRLNPGDRN